MDLGLLARGVVVGFSIAAPVGPIGVLVIRRTLSDGRFTGFVTGLGAATADTLYGLVGAFGLTAISSLLLDNSWWMRLIGGIFLLYLGVRTLLSRPAERPAEVRATSRLSAYLSTVALTITNPATILAFAAVFAGLGLGSMAYDYTSAVLVVIGIFIGSALWWFVLSGGVSLFRHRMSTASLIWVNRISGLIVIGFGIAALASMLLR